MGVGAQSATELSKIQFSKFCRVASQGAASVFDSDRIFLRATRKEGASAAPPISIGEPIAKAAGIMVTPWAKLRGAMALARGMGAGRGQNAVRMTRPLRVTCE